MYLIYYNTFTCPLVTCKRIIHKIWIFIYCETTFTATKKEIIRACEWPTKMDVFSSALLSATKITAENVFYKTSLCLHTMSSLCANTKCIRLSLLWMAFWQ